MLDSKYQILEKSYKMKSKGRVSTGIDGLDEMLEGGIPAGHIVVVIGDAGSGKTTLSLQYIYEGLCKGESCIYISIEEELESILSTAVSYGWDMRKYIETQKLEILKLDLTDIKTAARRIKVDLPELIKSLGATRLVIDSITLFGMMFDDPMERRIRLVDLNKTIKKMGITTLYTSETDIKNPFHSKDGIVEYSSDGILFLQQGETSNNIKMTLRILKMRRIMHDRMSRPYEISGTGIKVYPMEMVYDEGEKNINKEIDKRYFK
jgi:KaiC domain protein